MKENRTIKLSIVLFLILFGVSCTDISLGYVFQIFSDNILITYEQYDFDLPSSDPFSSQQEQSDAEDGEEKNLENDECPFDSQTIFYIVLSSSKCFHNLYNTLLSGSYTPPYIPPELLKQNVMESFVLR